jgi:competence protein ComEA
MSPANRRDGPGRWLPRRREQAVIAALVAAALVMIAVDWWRSGGASGRLIEIDRAAPLSAAFEVDVNRADWPELAQLPGVGETLARRIVESRAEHGPYNAIDDLRRVKGLGPKTLAGIGPYLVIKANSDTERKE